MIRFLLEIPLHLISIYLKNHDIITDRQIRNKLRFSKRCVFLFRFWFEFIKLLIPICSAAPNIRRISIRIKCPSTKEFYRKNLNRKLPSFTSGMDWLFDNWLGSVTTFGRGLWIKQCTTQLSKRPHAATVFASGCRTWPLNTKRTNFWAFNSSLKFRLKGKTNHINRR